MTGSATIDAAAIAMYVGKLVSAWGIGWAMGMAFRQFLRVLEMASS